jgi:hypothetical protein
MSSGAAASSSGEIHTLTCGLTYVRSVFTNSKPKSSEVPFFSREQKILPHLEVTGLSMGRKQVLAVVQWGPFFAVSKIGKNRDMIATSSIHM